MIECQFCKAKVRNKSTMYLHQETKSCKLQQSQQIIYQLQEQDKNKSCIITRLEEEDKHKSLSITRLESKFKTCLSQYQNLNDENRMLREQNRDLENEVNDLKMSNCELQVYKKQYDSLNERRNHIEDTLLEKATTKTNNTTINQNIINTLMPFDINDEERIQKLNNAISDDDLKTGGINRVAYRTATEFLSDSGNPFYGISDFSRNTGVYIDSENQVQKDPNMNQLIDTMDPIIVRALELSRDHSDYNNIMYEHIDKCLNSVAYLKGNKKHRRDFYDGLKNSGVPKV